jgi:hypothetical protein
MCGSGDRPPRAHSYRSRQCGFLPDERLGNSRGGVPDGQISSLSVSEPIPFVQPSTQKYSSFAFSELVIYSPRSAADTRGVRVVTNVVRNAMDARALTDERRIRGRRSRVVLAPRGSGAKLVMMRFTHHTGDGGKRDGSPRRSRISRKTIAQGRPV